MALFEELLLLLLTLPLLFGADVFAFVLFVDLVFAFPAGVGLALLGLLFEDLLSETLLLAPTEGLISPPPPGLLLTGRPELPTTFPAVGLLLRGLGKLLPAKALPLAELASVLVPAFCPDS